MNALSVFSFQENHPVRVVLVNGEPWFVAKDICDALKLVNSRKALSSLDDDEKNTVTLSDGNRGNPNMSIISESGLYTLILRCRDAVKQGTTAWRFRKWVTNEVLPAIRKTGGYQMVAKEERPPKESREPLTGADMDEISWVIRDISLMLRFKGRWENGIWFALRRATGTPSPLPFRVEDLPVVLSELQRILDAAWHTSSATIEFEERVLKEVVRQGFDTCEALEDISENLHLLPPPARYKLALERLRKISERSERPSLASW